MAARHDPLLVGHGGAEGRDPAVVVGGFDQRLVIDRAERAAIGERRHLAGDPRRNERRADDLRVHVWNRGAGRRAVILEDADVRRIQAIVTVDIAADDRCSVIWGELIERCPMVGCLHDHLVLLGGRIFVRENADAPRGAVAPDLRRRVGLVAGAEWAAVGPFAKNVRALLPMRRDEHRVAGDRIPFDHERSIRHASTKR